MVSGYQPITKATEGARVLYDLVRKAEGINDEEDGEIVPVDPHNLSSTDDTVNYAFEGESTNSELVYFSKKDLDGMRSTHTQNAGCTDSTRGIRVRYTVTITGSGKLAPVFVTVYGLSEKELNKELCPSGILIKKVRGLAYGGNVNVTNRHQVGWILFTRNQFCPVTGQSNDQRVAEYYRNEVFHPFIKEIRDIYNQDPLIDGTYWVNWQVRLLLTYYLFILFYYLKRQQKEIHVQTQVKISQWDCTY